MRARPLGRGATKVLPVLASLATALLVVALPRGATPTSMLERVAALAPPQVPPGSTALGPVAGSQQLDLGVVLPPSNPGDAASLVHDLYDPASPRFHRWLRPGQFATRFGPSAAAVTAVEAWLHGSGLTSTTRSGFEVRVRASARRVEAALGTGLERYRSPSGLVGYRAQRAPLVPANLAGSTVRALLGLDTLTRMVPHNELVPTPGGITLQPRATTTCPATASAPSSTYDTLNALGAAYGLGALVGAGLNGRGQQIALYELAAHAASDVGAYASCFGLTNPISTVSVDGGPGAPGGNGTVEADLDIEQAATQAPGASIISYEGPNTAQGAYDTWAEIVSQDVASVVSTSWGICEPLAAAAGETAAFTTLFEEAAAQGQSVLAASGDSGSEDCYTSSGSTALAVDYPASDPHVAAVGGTTLLGPGDEVAWNGNGAGGGGGLSSYFVGPSWQPAVVHWANAGSTTCAPSCREVPDLSVNAGFPMLVYAGGAWVTGEGTSFASPFVAGLVADRDTGCTALTGDFAAPLYRAAAQGAYGTALTDIVSGNNDVTGTNGGAYPATPGLDGATGLGSPLAAGLSCPEVTGTGSGYAGQQVAVTGLGLEGANIAFGGAAAQVVSSDATSATVVVPAGSGTVTVRATSELGTGIMSVPFTYQAPPPAPPPPPQHGYWLVGGDGGIFSFGSAQFYGSTGNLHLQRPVVGITSTAGHGGYWLVAGDGGVFAFGDAGFYGSIPGLGIGPAGSTAGRHLDQPIVGAVPSADGRGYFMVAADGGVFAFGDARFAGSCPAIGGCVGTAVAVVPDATGNGYWLVTSTGAVYAFGDAPYLGAPGPRSSPVTAAAATPDGRGYWILFADGTVVGYGDAPDLGGPVGAVGVSNPASAIFAVAGGGGYWVASADGAVHPYGGAPDDGSMAGRPLNAPIVTGTGW